MLEYDFLVLGQGLAGTAVAWWLRWAGKKTLVVDRETEVTSSKIAAGLITPITGQKLVRSWKHEKLWPAAIAFYRQVEEQTGGRFFHEVDMVRLLSSPDEHRLFNRRLAAGDYGSLVSTPDPPLDPATFKVEPGAFEMSPGGQLDVPRYLAASRDLFQSDGDYITADLDVSRDMELEPASVRIPRLEVRAHHVVFCQGIDALNNPWFRDVQFKPAKGEILTLQIPGLAEQRVVHRGVWLAPIGGDLYKAGSTYDWEHLNQEPTAEGREEILAKLGEFLHPTCQVESHQAAVRPIHRNQYPVLGQHPVHPQLGYLNGLGSKGSLHAPEFARQLVELLLHQTPVDPAVDLNRKTIWRDSNPPDPSANAVSDFHVKRRPNRPLTEQAQDAVQSSVRRGDIVIDATAGNGHDTQFLAEAVGPQGTVYAFDVQPEAIRRTATRLSDQGMENVELLQRDHGVMAAVLPGQTHGHVAAVMFNLGYLPGGDKTLTTKVDSTCAAISQAATLLRAGGVITILCYTGHDGGTAEALLVEQQLDKFPRETFDVTIIESQPGRSSGPRLFIVKRRDDGAVT